MGKLGRGKAQETNTGLYMIMAPDDFDAFVSDFNANVAPVTPLVSSS